MIFLIAWCTLVNVRQRLCHYFFKHKNTLIILSVRRLRTSSSKVSTSVNKIFITCPSQKTAQSTYINTTWLKRGTRWRTASCFGAGNMICVSIIGSEVIFVVSWWCWLQVNATRHGSNSETKAAVLLRPTFIWCRGLGGIKCCYPMSRGLYEPTQTFCSIYIA